jgi:gamma-polyglutamate biosynthesis protein CapA
LQIISKKNNFGLLSLANNHSMDFGKSGYEETKNNLDKVGILYFGSGYNENDISTKIILDNKNFCFIAYHDLYTKNEVPVIEEIKKIKDECYKIIVFPHWGEEYVNSFVDRQKVLAHKFIDEGADLIIGTHPHVVEPIEIYKDKAIFYSIGNFVFDQYFSFETEHSIALKVLFKEKETEFNFVPVEIKSGIVTFADETSAQKILSALITENQTEKQKKDILENYHLVVSN